MSAPAVAERLDIRRLGPHLGAEVVGLDLSDPLPEPVIESLAAAFVEHEVLFFPDQDLSPAQQISFASQFGEVTRPTAAMRPDDDYPHTVEFGTAQTQGLPARRPAEGWHADITFVERPPLGAVLHLIDLPDIGGDTLFASARAAYEHLSAPLRRLLDGLTATHSPTGGTGAVLRRFGPGEWEGQPVLETDEVEHPVVHVHPVTGRRSLFVNPDFTTFIVGLSPIESAGLLATLREHTTQPEFTVRYRWAKGGVAFWDNRSVWHRPVADYEPGTRTARRVLLRGTKPTPVDRRA